MDFISDALLDYCQRHSEPESELLRDLNRQTHIRIRNPRMLSGHLQGRLLAMISKLLNPSQILEIGTYTGYSALCLAEGLKQQGTLVTIDPNEETNEFARHYFRRSPFKDQITLLEGDAGKIVPTLKGPFDLVFIDADKHNYLVYFELIIDKVRPGGLIIADNVLWSGKVLDTAPDGDTRAILTFNRSAAADNRVEPLMLPVRDGLLLLRRKPHTL